MNAPAERLTGWVNEDVREREIGMVLPLRESASDMEANKALVPPACPQPPCRIPRGLMARKRSGQWFPIEGEMAPSVDDGRVVGAVITFRDATARQAEENEARHQYKMQAVGRLAAGIAHDFNNLLVSILGYTDEILHASAALNDDAVRSLIEIRKAGDHAASLTQQLLKFSRKEPVLMREVNLNDVIRDTEELIRRLGGPSVVWQFRLDPSLGEVWADRGQLKQVVLNLAANARDAMPHGGTVTIETANVDVPQTGSFTNIWEAFVALTMTDMGSGMTPETAEHLFEPFFTTKPSGSGTGLGLSIVHSIVSDLGGTIHVDSEPGRGATFAVYLPVSGSGARVPLLDATELREFPVEIR